MMLCGSVGVRWMYVDELGDWPSSSSGSSSVRQLCLVGLRGKHVGAARRELSG